MSREENGRKLFENGQYEYLGCKFGIHTWNVDGSEGKWLVKFGNGVWECECPDHFYRRSRCKHIRCCMLDAKERGIKLDAPVMDYKEDTDDEDFGEEEELEGIDLDEDETDFLGMMEDPDDF